MNSPFKVSRHLKFDRRPLLWVAVFLAGGISAGYFFPLSPLFLFLLVFTGAVNYHILKKRRYFILFFFITVLSGYLLISWQEIKFNDLNSITNWNGSGPREVTGEIIEGLNDLEGRTISLKPLLVNGSRIKYGLIQLKKDELPGILKNGQLITLNLILETPPDRLNPGEFSYREYLKRQGIFSLGYLAGDNPVILKKKSRVFINSLLKIKKSLLMTLNRIRAPYNELLKALLLGERENLPVEWEERFSRAGINHLLAISGLHVGFVMIIFLGLLRMTGLPMGIKNFIITLLLGLYIIITGFRPSVFRAGLLAISFLWAPYFKRRGDLLNLLGFAALVNLSLRPYDLFNIGFQLTYLVLIMIILWYPLLRSWLFPPLAVSVAAQFGSLPLIAYYFNLLSPAGLITNLWAIPMVGLVVSLGLVGLLMGLIHPVFSWLILQPAVFLLYLVGQGTGLTVQLPFSWLEVPSPSPLMLIISICLLLILPIILRQKVMPFNRQQRSKRLYYILILVLVLLLVNLFRPFLNNELEIVFLAVGQGDSILLKTPEGRTILIDGGGMAGLDSSKGEKVILPYLRKRGIRRLELVFATHFDADHVLGLKEIIEKREVGLLLIPINYRKNQLATTIIDLAFYHNTPVRTGLEGDYFQLGEVRIDILGPDKFTSLSGNDNSLVLQVSYRQFRMILTGDLGKSGEYRLIKSGRDLGSDILKLGHHGSDSSSSLTFLNSVAPREAIVSVGKNSYGHPDKTVLKRVKDRGIRIWRTDRQGAITVKTDGYHYLIKGFKKY